MSKLRSLIRGAVAGASATVPMSAVMAGGERLHMLGEPPPRKITRAGVRAVNGSATGAEVDALSWASHFAFGAVMGAAYGLLVGDRRPSIASGILFGTAVWAVSYAGWVPALGIMPSPSRDRPLRPEVMLVAHWAYGASLARRLQG